MLTHWIIFDHDDGSTMMFASKEECEKYLSENGFELHKSEPFSDNGVTIYSEWIKVEEFRLFTVETVAHVGSVNFI